MGVSKLEQKYHAKKLEAEDLKEQLDERNIKLEKKRQEHEKLRVELAQMKAGKTTSEGAPEKSSEKQASASPERSAKAAVDNGAAQAKEAEQAGNDKHSEKSSPSPTKD